VPDKPAARTSVPAKSHGFLVDCPCRQPRKLNLLKIPFQGTIGARRQFPLSTKVCLLNTDTPLRGQASNAISD
jgi:hypothetical protein